LAVVQSTEQTLKEITNVGDELVKYISTLKLEKETKKEISRFVYEFQSAFSGELKLNAKHLSEWFPPAKSAALVGGETLVLRTGKKETRISVLELKPDSYVAVVKEAAASVAKLMAEEKTRREASRAGSIKPALQMFTGLKGGKLAVFDWRSYSLLVSNTGGAAKRVTVYVTSLGGQKHGPLQINKGETVELELGVFRRLRKSGDIRMVVMCEDQDGRKYRGKAKLELNAKEAQVLSLSRAD
jgi:hypothetical protein